jgi:hypothetical protein
VSKTLAVLAAAFVMGLAGLAAAEDSPKKEASPAQKAHRERMSACSKDAKQQGLKGDQRKAFMRQCLSGETAASQEPDSARSQTAACRKDARAKGLKGGERKRFMSECVGSEASAAQ